jgi:hypothetical protein
MNNMALQAPSFTASRDSVSFAVCVTDSLINGSFTIRIRDSAFNFIDTSFSYCTILDSSPPKITWNAAQGTTWINLELRDDGPWDRGLKSYSLKYISNVKFDSALSPIKAGDSAYSLTASIIDSTMSAHFSVQARDVAGNSSIIDTFRYTGTAGVAQSANDQISISIFPNPTSGGTTIWLDGAPSAEVTVMDVLGRTVEQFRLEGSHEWQPALLAPGAYTLRAAVGDAVLFKRIVRE